MVNTFNTFNNVSPRQHGQVNEMDITITARDGKEVKVGDKCVFATPRGTSVMIITEIRDADAVYAKSATDSGTRWACNILRHATEKECENLNARLEYEREFSEWYNDKIKNRYGQNQRL